MKPTNLLVNEHRVIEQAPCWPERFVPRDANLPEFGG